MSIDQAPVRRLRGRPAKLSAERIIAAAVEVLAKTPADQFTLAMVAERLGAPVTSVYNYFPNRFALLSALAEVLFTRFEFTEPAEDTPWPEALMAWLRAVDRFFLQHPVAIKVIGTDGQTSPAWGWVRAPLTRQLRRAGLAGRELAAAALATHAQLIGLLFVSPYVLRPQPADGAVLPPDASQVEKDEAELRAHRAHLDREDIVGFGLEAIVRQLQATVAARAA